MLALSFWILLNAQRKFFDELNLRLKLFLIPYGVKMSASLSKTAPAKEIYVTRNAWRKIMVKNRVMASDDQSHTKETAWLAIEQSALIKS